MREHRDSAGTGDRIDRALWAQALARHVRALAARQQMPERVVDALRVALRDECTRDRRSTEGVVMIERQMGDDVVDRHIQLAEPLRDAPEPPPPLLTLNVER